MVEKDIQVIWGNYIKTHLRVRTEVYELKMCKGTSMAFDKVAEHQEKALIQAATGNLYHKISDSPYGGSMKFTFKKPFDCLNICKAHSYVVVMFYAKGKLKEFIMISIFAFLNERDTCKRKSITEKRAKEICEKVVRVKGKKSWEVERYMLNESYK